MVESMKRGKIRGMRKEGGWYWQVKEEGERWEEVLGCGFVEFEF